LTHTSAPATFCSALCHCPIYPEVPFSAQPPHLPVVIFAPEKKRYKNTKPRREQVQQRLTLSKLQSKFTHGNGIVLPLTPRSSTPYLAVYSSFKCKKPMARSWLVGLIKSWRLVHTLSLSISVFFQLKKKYISVLLSKIQSNKPNKPHIFGIFCYILIRTFCLSIYT